MECRTKLEFNSFLEKKVFLYGETNTYKTFCSAEFIQFLLEEKKIDPNLISIIDFAPKLQTFNDLKIGGKFKDYYGKSTLCRYLDPKNEIIPPRLNATNKKQLYKNACHNYNQTIPLLHTFEKAPTPYLLINDMSIYLHLGNPAQIIKIVEKSHTFLGNSYYGKTISEKAKFARLFSLKEHLTIKHLLKYFDRAILMDCPSSNSEVH
ncbi:MAG: hypothetical protein BAJALOKI3v1_150034 [Promethearchaeota archaeon]|nr:MAG: hypothetical protein BAJALOKI3v1_150034 [Candidatus Lokiarchaeota archaeon]